MIETLCLLLTLAQVSAPTPTGVDGPFRLDPPAWTLTPAQVRATPGVEGVGFVFADLAGRLDLEPATARYAWEGDHLAWVRVATTVPRMDPMMARVHLESVERMLTARYGEPVAPRRWTCPGGSVSLGLLGRAADGIVAVTWTRAAQ